MSRSLLIRADASAATGAGHIMRCLALAQEWQRDGGGVTLVHRELTPFLAERLRAAGLELKSSCAELGSVSDAEFTVQCTKSAGASWIVADGYHFGERWQARVVDSGARLLVLDDYGHAERYVCDFILNQNSSFATDLYRERRPDCQLLLGPKFALLRREFLALPEPRRAAQREGRRVLVTFGGTDTADLTARTVASLAKLADITLTVVISSIHPAREELAAMMRPLGERAHLILNAANMADVAASCDVAISAGGSTAWELAFLGVPAALVTTAENQRPVVATLVEAGAAVPVGDASFADDALLETISSLLDQPVRRIDMARAARALVDGRGAERVVTRLRAADLNLRRAEDCDAKLLWEWVNDPAVRASAFNSSPVAWDAHCGWLRGQLGDSANIIWVASDSLNEPVGQVRLTPRGPGEAEIHVSVAPGRRGCGRGAALIRRAVDEAFRSSRWHVITARIKRENAASVRAFEKAGFRPRHEQPAARVDALEMEIVAHG